MDQSLGAMRYIELHNTQVVNIWKTMTAKIVKGLISGSKGTASSVVVHQAELSAFLATKGANIDVACYNFDEKLQNLTRYNLLNKIIRLPAWVLAFALICPMSLAALMSVITLTTYFMFLETVGIYVIALGKALKEVGNVVKSVTTAIHTASRDGIEKFLSERHRRSGNTDQYEEELENSTNQKNEFVAMALAYTVAGATATLMVCVIFPIALLSALASFIPVAYMCNKSAKFRDKVVDALVLDISYNNVKSVEDLVHMPQVSRSCRDYVKCQLSSDLEKMSAEYLGELHRNVRQHRLAAYSSRNA
ncbi:hypothetical protein ANPL_03365 [Anaplasma platys]|uniref:Uncharacterized protein n=1 Tax=Anaplasma platys TaxID=949 RepID=A0A858PYQ1_9RICK|nr:hypothetical protein [Anaplasma platys]QJC27731.1 hypothetical protein ANPL_03365 [Anaplasma platys]